MLEFFAAFLSNYYLNHMNSSGFGSLNSETVWRWMLGIEMIPAMLYFVLLFFVPESPRWLYVKSKTKEALHILQKLHGETMTNEEGNNILLSVNEERNKEKVQISEIFKPALRFIMIVGLVIGVLQQITGINAIYFYATSIFKQTGIGTDAAFQSGVLLSLTSVVFTVVAMLLIDRMGRRPLLLIGIGGIAISLFICCYGFSQATYKLTPETITKIVGVEGVKSVQSNQLESFKNKIYDNDVDFKRDMKAALGNQLYGKKEGVILEQATNMNATLVLIGILGFIACFAFSLGPVMWVMLSELYPNKYRGLAIGVVGFVNSFTSWVVQQIFPWELSNLGNAMSFFIFGIIAAFGFFILLKILPETKGKTLEELEEQLIDK